MSVIVVFYCERAAGFCGDVGYRDKAYLDAIVRMFEHALKTAANLTSNVQRGFLSRLDRVRSFGRQLGNGIGEDMDVLLSEFESSTNPRSEGLMAYKTDSYNQNCHKNEEGGNWFNATDHYLGIKFRVHGKAHYGWARLSVVDPRRHPRRGFTATLTGYAYETIPNKVIVAGKRKAATIEAPSASLTIQAPTPATLGTLAMGSSGLSIWRREESVGPESQATSLRTQFRSDV